MHRQVSLVRLTPPRGGRLSVVLAIALAALAGCRKQSEQAAVPASRPAPGLNLAKLPRITGRPGMNVLLVSADTLRADHLGCYGHPTIKTPNIDRLAREGTRFAWCISSAPLTLVSHATMLTGSYQYVHGARDNGLFVLGGANETLAEIFKAAGYRTDAETATVILEKAYGCDQGFDHYGEIALESSEPVELLLDPKDPGAEDTKKDIWLDRKADEITKRGIDMLRARAADSKPFFVFLHYYDPHFPHEAPEPFCTQYADGYFAEIAYFDFEFGKLIDELDLLGLADKTLVILTSDHGESRGQHGEYTHSALIYDATQHVPLIMRCKDVIPADQVVENQVRLVDLAPTILEFAGLGSKCTEQMQGESLLPFMANPKLYAEMPCYLDTIVTKTTYGYSPLRGLRTAEWKYILAPVSELYDLKSDPQEVLNLALSDPDQARQFRQRLWDLVEQSPPPPGQRASTSDANGNSLNKLLALGYASSPEQIGEFGTGSELDHFEPEGENPRDHVEEINLICFGLASFRSGQYEVAETQLRRLLQLDPENPIGLSNLGQTLMKLDRPQEAIEYLTHAVRRRPDSIPDYRTLAMLYASTGRYAEAESTLRKAVAVSEEDDDDQCRIDLAAALSIQGRNDEALGILKRVPRDRSGGERAYGIEAVIQFRLGHVDLAIGALNALIKLNPAMAQAHIDLAAIYAETGRPDEAIDYLRKKLEELPKAASLYTALAGHLAGKKDLEGAGAILEEGTHQIPDSGDLLRSLGINLLERGKPEEAVAKFRKAVEVNPDLKRAWLLLAQTLEALKRYKESLDAYDHILARWEKTPEVYRPAAHVAAAADQPDRMAAILQKGHELYPGDYTLANDLAWVLATSSRDDLRDGGKAIVLAEEAAAISERDDPNFLDTLAAAYAEAGRFDDAVKTAQRAVDLAEKNSDAGMVGAIKSRLNLYQARKSFREP